MKKKLVKNLKAKKGSGIVNYIARPRIATFDEWINNVLLVLQKQFEIPLIDFSIKHYSAFSGADPRRAASG